MVLLLAGRAPGDGDDAWMRRCRLRNRRIRFLPGKEFYVYIHYVYTNYIKKKPSLIIIVS